jgi:hypothetical protein
MQSSAEAYLKRKDKALHAAIDDMGLMSLLRPRKNKGVVFLMPKSNQYRGKIIDLAYSKPEDAVEMIKALIIPKYISRLSDFKSSTVFNALLNKIEFNENLVIEGTEIFVTALDDFKYDGSEASCVYSIEGPGEMPINGVKVLSSTVKNNETKKSINQGFLNITRELKKNNDSVLFNYMNSVLLYMIKKTDANTLELGQLLRYAHTAHPYGILCALRNLYERANNRQPLINSVLSRCFNLNNRLYSKGKTTSIYTLDKWTSNSDAFILKYAIIDNPLSVQAKRRSINATDSCKNLIQVVNSIFEPELANMILVGRNSLLVQNMIFDDIPMMANMSQNAKKWHMISALNGSPSTIKAGVVFIKAQINNFMDVWKDTVVLSPTNTPKLSNLNGNANAELIQHMREINPTGSDIELLTQELRDLENME